VTAAGGLTASAGLAGPAEAGRGEQTRARYPDETGWVERDGVPLFWERYGDTGPNVVLLPTWSIIHSRFWKFQIPYLARRCRVITFDGRGNGRSGRPAGADAYRVEQFAADTVAVMDATATPTATLLALSCGALWAMIVAAEHPGRVERIACIGPAVSLAPHFPERDRYAFDEPLDTDAGWAKYNSFYWSRNYREFLEFFAGQCFSEPHSTKQIEDFVGWALATTPEVLADTTRGIILGGRLRWRERCAEVRCPVLVIHGDGDQVRPHAQGAALAQATGGELVTLAGAGHLPLARDPVRVNRLLSDFICGPARPARWSRAMNRARRVLYVSSPIGLGHVRRDLAIARELRRQSPGLRIEWLAQHPVTAVLQAEGEFVHPASAELASESAHIQSEHAAHDLHCFQAIRRMDEILLANFMVFCELTREESYDLWVGDEAWEVDYFLHENPELKTAAYAWLTDFVGWLPMPDGGEAEAALTAELNAEMIGHIERFPRVRDRAIFIGEPSDIVPAAFGPGLPGIREWTEAHYRFSGYVSGFDPSLSGRRSDIRAELGFAPGDAVCVATVGGSGVGEPLLRGLVEAHAIAREMVPELRLIVVSGPRIDPANLPRRPGVEALGHVDDLPALLAASDLGLIQGGLSTGMELIAAGRPFIAFPLGHHFEQNFHVRHRLERYGARRFMDFARVSAEEIAAAICHELAADPGYLPIEPGGAQRAASIIGELL
jgi:pimeloyl-ACP methyl ester carboxylesterase/predicted glycosyltransferase